MSEEKLVTQAELVEEVQRLKEVVDEATAIARERAFKPVKPLTPTAEDLEIIEGVAEFLDYMVLRSEGTNVEAAIREDSKNWNLCLEAARNKVAA